MTKHKVKQGECILSIAENNGFFWETLWNSSDNSDLKRKRENPNELEPGDIVVIPDKQLKEVTGGTEQKHRFRRKGVPAKLRLQVKRNDEPRANVPYQLTIDGDTKTGQTDSNGIIEEAIPPNAVQAELKIGDVGNEEIYTFNLGTLDPIDTDNGIKGRLRNLGYDVTRNLSDAIRAFQVKEGLQDTGVADEATKAKLVEKFGQ
jgi:murein L,D-transpeptidase YcbB/YkuD